MSQENRVIRKRDEFMHHAHRWAQTRHPDRLYWVRFNVKAAMEWAPLSQRQIDNLIGRIGYDATMRAIQGIDGLEAKL